MSLKTIKKGEFIHSSNQGPGFMGFIASLGNMEIVEVSIVKGKNFLIVPSNTNPVKEFIYILEGCLKASDGTKLGRGDALIADEISEAVFYEALEDTKTLYISQEEIVEKIGDNMDKLHDLMDQLNQKDQYTKNHCSRVVEWIPKLGPLLDIPSEKMWALVDAAIFHDIGKMYIDDQILLKAGKLTDQEFDQIKKHPKYGYDLALEYDYNEVAKIILQHHERYDGSGYPNGLKGQDICLEARIIAVIDSYDAMTTNRPYRKALSKEDAVKELVKYRGIHYDPMIVDQFIRLLDENKC